MPHIIGRVLGLPDAAEEGGMMGDAIVRIIDLLLHLFCLVMAATYFLNAEVESAIFFAVLALSFRR